MVGLNMRFLLSSLMLYGTLTLFSLSYAQTTTSDSSALDDFYAYKPASIECVIEAAHRQSVPANILLAIASIEGGKNGQLVRNTNGSIDIGHFQINTIQWKYRFSRYPIQVADVALRGCYNAELAAWLVSQHLAESSEQDFWTKAANYHSKTPKYNHIYREKLIPLSIRWGKWLTQHYPETTISYK